MIDVAVIGGGAAGMMAALEAASRGAAVSVFERQARVGRKLSVTGNGRCNLTNLQASSAHYHGETPDFAGPALRRFGPEETLRRFRELGLLTTVQADGRAYPLSDSAGSVVDVLRYAMEAGGVRLRTGCEVKAVKAGKKGFRICLSDGEAYADRVVVACGGAAGERFGGSELGYRLLEGLGHTCTPLRCSLVQLRSDNPGCRSLKGIRADAAVTVTSGGNLIAATEGEVQFTDYGLSGPAVFEISRAALEKPDTVVSLDLLRGIGEDELAGMLLHRAKSTPQLSLADVFLGTVQNRIGRVLVTAAGLKSSESITALDEKTASRLAKLVKHFRFAVTGDMGPVNAQVTAGGIRTDGFDPFTLESRLCPGLYACGEVLDVDGDCGGYNLQWAWSSGHLAGACAAEV
jgi:predicted Rossmann fold flavoprotein